MDYYGKIGSIDKKIIIFGAGKAGQFIQKKCLENGVSVSAFCDNVLGKEHISIYNLPVFTFDELQKVYDRNIVFIISVRDIASVVQQIRMKGNYQWYPAYLFYELDEILQDMPFMEKQKLEAVWYVHNHYCDKEQMNLDTIDVVITEKCSLRCRECSNLMQYYDQPQNYSFQTLKKEIDRLLEIYDEIYEVRLLGGEPFMNLELDKIVAYLNAIDAIKCICIYTNATILPNKKQILEMNKGKVWFSISNYGGLSRNLSRLVTILQENNIGYELKNIEYWTSCSGFHKHDRSLAEAERVYRECCAKGLITLLKGKLYSCPFIANAINLKAIPVNRSDYVNIMRNDLSFTALREEIQKCLCNRKMFISCDYCIGRPSVTYIKDQDKIVPYQQSHTVLPYRRYE